VCSVLLNSRLDSSWLHPVNCYVVLTIYAVNHILNYDTMTAIASSSLFSDIINRLYDM
jgi:hypothetical protein